MSSLSSKLAALRHIDATFAAATADRPVACRKHCAQCCTCNVTLTTLEGYRIVSHLAAAGLPVVDPQVLATRSRRRFQPATTVNRLADLCRQGQEVPLEKNDPRWGRCPFLSGDLCRIYAVRPFACRCMASGRDCRQNGYAEPDDFVLALATVCQQFIEHVDADGFSGNLVDILVLLAPPTAREEYRRSQPPTPVHGLLSNQPASVLMIPPEHRHAIAPIVRTLQHPI